MPLVLLQLFSSSLLRHIRLESFFIYVTLHVLLHPSCSVVSYFMFIPMYVILLFCHFQLPCFNLHLDEINFCGSEDLKSVKSVCDFTIPWPSVVSSMLQMKNIKPLPPPKPPAMSSFTHPVKKKLVTSQNAVIG